MGVDAERDVRLACPSGSEKRTTCSRGARGRAMVLAGWRVPRRPTQLYRIERSQWQRTSCCWVLKGEASGRSHACRPRRGLVAPRLLAESAWLRDYRSAVADDTAANLRMIGPPEKSVRRRTMRSSGSLVGPAVLRARLPVRARRLSDGRHACPGTVEHHKCA
jgi:hypothetical protein